MGIKEQNFEAGKIVEFGGKEWDVLARVPGDRRRYLCITHDIVCYKPFDEENNNDWLNSTLRKWLNTEFIKSLSDVVIEDTEVDLVTDDGLFDYGAAEDKVFLLTQEQYKAYRDNMNDVEDWWWLVTAHSTKTNYVRTVYTDGSLHHSNAYYGSIGVRPACVLDLESSIELQESREKKAAYTVEIRMTYDPKELEKINVEVTEEEFEKYYKEIKRDGADELLNFLKEKNFFTQPASRKYHGAYDGGLARHSINVYKRLKWLCEYEKETYSEETIAIVSLLHDLCKADLYKKTTEGGYVYVCTDEFPVGHGEKSVFRILQYMKLSDEEIMAIRWHMGGYDVSQTGQYDLNKAQRQSKLVTLLHIADMLASRLDD